jgi:DNA-3-methyladenine glycosylase
MATGLDRSFWNQPVVDLARALIGMELLVDGVGGVIVETEAYDIDDPASHSFGGERLRNAAMFGPLGHAYVYRIYGIHWCLNLVGGQHPGSAVLIRAIEPTRGLETMARRRGLADPRALCSGPGKLAQALAVTGALNALPLDQAPFSLAVGSPHEVVVGPRIGITKAVEQPWRFGVKGSRHLSRPFPRP